MARFAQLLRLGAYMALMSQQCKVSTDFGIIAMRHHVSHYYFTFTNKMACYDIAVWNLDCRPIRCRISSNHWSKQPPVVNNTNFFSGFEVLFLAWAQRCTQERNTLVPIASSSWDTSDLCNDTAQHCLRVDLIQIVSLSVTEWETRSSPKSKYLHQIF